MSIDRVAVTGGSGKIGQRLLADLAEKEYDTINVNRGHREESTADEYVQADLVDSGDAYGALAKSAPDAIVHLGMIPTPTANPEHTVFESNAMSTYHVLEAAQALGVDSVVLASSLSALGAGYEQQPVRLAYLPVDENHPLTPSTAYGMGKQALELIADGFSRRGRPPTTITSLRFPWVMSEDELHEHFLTADRTLEGLRRTDQFHTARNTLFGYLHLDDAVRAIEHAMTADVEGHEPFWITAADTTVAETTEVVLETVFADVDLRADFEGHESLFETDRAARLLGWEPRRSWRDLF